VTEHDDAGRPDPASDDAAPAPRIRRQGRRVRTEPVAGSDPAPEPEPRRHSGGENDDRLRGDVPPHY
jgi:hypothetical protein